MGDPENEGRFSRAREVHRRIVQRGLERRGENETLVAGFTLRAPIQPVDREAESLPDHH
jgi:hypothetical protein